MWRDWWFHPFLRYKPSLNSDLSGEKCNILRVARLASSMLLSVMTGLLSVFFSDYQFSIVLAFFEGVMFCLSLLMFQFL